MNTLTTKDKLARLEDWEKQYRNLDSVFKDLEKAGLGVGAPVWNAAWSLFDKYTDSVSENLGIPHDWLGYYQGECCMGEKPRDVHITENGRKRKIVVKDLRSMLKVAEASA